MVVVNIPNIWRGTRLPTNVFISLFLHYLSFSIFFLLMCPVFADKSDLSINWNFMFWKFLNYWYQIIPFTRCPRMRNCVSMYFHYQLQWTLKAVEIYSYKLQWTIKAVEILTFIPHEKITSWNLVSPSFSEYNCHNVIRHVSFAIAALSGNLATVELITLGGDS